VGGLSATLGISSNALEADEGALEVTSNNIANANTPGYTREVPVLTETAPVQVGSLSYGQGVTLENIQSISDPVLQLSIQQETSVQGQLTSFTNAMDQVQSLFNETDSVGLQSAMSQFFDSLQSLSTDPTSASLGQAVLSAGQNLSTSFHQTASSLTQIQSGLNQNVTQDVSQINQLTSQIAQVNGQIQSLQAQGSDVGTLQDQRTELVNQLSNLTGLSVTNNAGGNYTLSTQNGSLLVVGNQSFNLTTQVNSTTGMQDVYANGTDITSTITQGDLGGLIQARDTSIPNALNSLNTLAYNLVNAVNTQSTAGYDSAGNAGVDFFTPLTSGSVTGAASQISVAITDPSQIATSSAATATGSNGNVLALANVQNQAMTGLGGETVTDYYSNLVDNIGNQVSSANSQQTTASAVMEQLQNQLTSVSGVSIDEEAANLVQYQNAYEASAQVISLVNQLMQTTINMV
jgi:flagellar hook-associated protein 1